MRFYAIARPPLAVARTSEQEGDMQFFSNGSLVENDTAPLFRVWQGERVASGSGLGAKERKVPVLTWGLQRADQVRFFDCDFCDGVIGIIC